MVNLAPAQAAVERLMTDRVRLHRNPFGVHDDTMSPDPNDLELDPGAFGVFYDGKATVKVSEAAENGAASSLPLAVVALEDDLVEVVESRDAAIVGRWFRVDEVRGGTFSVSRRVVLAEVAAPPWS